MEWPSGFFDRVDESSDPYFYRTPRFVTHIDDRAIAAVGDLYEQLGVDGEVLDLMSSWVSHFRRPPRRLTVLGMNREELDANPQAAARVVHDLNANPTLPFPAGAFDAAVCCVSVDYLTAPVEVFCDLSRVVRPGGTFVCTFSNRLFPTKAVRGWLYATDEDRCEVVAAYFRAAGVWSEPLVRRCTPLHHPGDPLFGVWAFNHRDASAATDGPTPEARPLTRP